MTDAAEDDRERELKQLRTEIDALDSDLLRRVNRRAELARAIGHLKSGAAYRPDREAQVLQRLADANPGPLARDSVLKLFRELMSACLALEQPLCVAYLGPEGTFSEAAAAKQFGHGVRTAACRSIDEVFRNVESETADYGIAPGENSTEGAIGHTLDLMIESPLKVCGETLLRIHHHLLARRDDLAFAAIGKVYSHAQSLGQCQEWLNRNLARAERIPVASNAEAARLAAQDNDSAAIAGENAAARHGLAFLARNIEDQPNNTTRFLVLGRHDAAPSGRDKTSLVMSAKHRPGAMHELLAPFAAHGVSMTRLESRPSRTGLWEYVFFVDIEGHAGDARIAMALDEVRDRALFLKVLGSYPVAVF